MKKEIFFRALAIMALSLAVTVGAQAQLGNAINRARNAVQGAGNQTQGGNAANPVAGAVENATGAAVQAATFTAAEREAFDKLMDKSKRTTPEMKELSHQDDYEIRRWFGALDGKQLGAYQTVGNAKAFKAALEARTDENRAMFCALHEMPDGYDPAKLTDDYNFAFGYSSDRPGMKEHISQELSRRSSSADDNLLRELENYQTIMKRAADQIPAGKVALDAPGVRTISFDRKLSVGFFTLGEEGLKDVFFRSGLITPLDDDHYEWETTKYDIVQTLLKKDNDPEFNNQSDKWWLAWTALGSIKSAQRNSLAMQTKAPVPKAGMTNATLEAQMLAAAKQSNISDWNPQKVIIRDTDWVIDRDALGNILRRRLNTYVICKDCDNYTAREIGFAQDHTGGGNYGSTKFYGVGIGSFAVDYK